MTMTPYGGSHAWSSEFVTDPLMQRIEDNVTHLKERLDRQVQLVDTANAGQYELVVLNGTDTVERTTTQGQAGPIGVTLMPMTAGGTAQFVRFGGIAEVKIDSAVAVNDPIRPSATVGRAEACTLGSAGIFGFARTPGAAAGNVVEVIMVGPGAAGGGGGGGGGSIWDPHSLAVVPVLTDFTLTSHIGGSDSVTQESDRIIIHLAGSLSGNEQGIFLPLPTIPFIWDVGLIPYVAPEYSVSLVLLESVSDKRSQLRLYFHSTTGLWEIQDYKYSDYHTASSGGGVQSYGGATQPIWLQAEMSGGNRDFRYGWNGQDWRTKNIDTYTAAGFLPSNPTHVGITINANGVSEPGEVHIVHAHVH